MSGDFSPPALTSLSLSEHMTVSSRMPLQSRARPWQWCQAHHQPPPKCCSSHLPTVRSASQQLPWLNSTPPCKTCAWPIGTHCRPTNPGACLRGAQACPRTPLTPPSSPWVYVPSLRLSACRWPSQLSPGTALPPLMEAATSVGATCFPQAVLIDRPPGPSGDIWKTQVEEEHTKEESHP